MRLPWISILILSVACIALLSCPSQATADYTITAHFDGGDSDTVVDAYTGMAGDGWGSPWTPKSDSDAINTVQVLESGETGYVELKPGSGNYLDVVSASDGDESRFSVCRDYTDGNTTNFDPSLPYEVKFTVRINEDMDPATTTFDHWDRDLYFIYDYNKAHNSTSSSMRWGIALHGGLQESSSVARREWRFVDSHGTTSFPTDGGTGIIAETGGVYDFAIQVFPGESHGNWSATIVANPGTEDEVSFSQSDMTWRSDSSEVGGWINFLTWAKDENDQRAWSIDNLEIAQIPEPSTWVLMLFGTASVCLCHRHRRY